MVDFRICQAINAGCSTRGLPYKSRSFRWSGLCPIRSLNSWSSAGRGCGSGGGVRAEIGRRKPEIGGRRADGPPLHPGQATGCYLTPALAQVKTLTRPSQIPHPAAPPSPVRREKGISHRLGEGQGTARAWASTAMSIFGSRFVLKPDSQGFSTLKNGFLTLKRHFETSEKGHLSCLF